MFFLRVIVAACLLSAVGSAQLLTTTLVNSPGDWDTQVVLASTQGLVAGSEVYIDREAMRVRSVAGAVVAVYRGVDGTRVTSHISGSDVYAGPSSLFWSSDQSGVCAEPSTLPRINVLSGLRWYCTGGQWVAVNGAGGASIVVTTAALRGNGVGGASAVTGTASDCVKVNGSSGPCGVATIASVTGALKGDGVGGAGAVTGTASDCVKVDGSSGACGSGGTAQVATNGGTAATARSIIDFMDGSAATWVINDTGSRIQVTASAAAGIQTKANAQSGAYLLCSAGSASPLTCTMSPTLTTYTDKMLVNLCVTGAITGAATLNIDTVGAKSLLTFAGANPASGDLGTGCRLVTYQTSDTSFRLPAGGSAAGGVTTTAVSLPMPVGGCLGTGVGNYFNWGLSAAGGVTGACPGPNNSQVGLSYSNTATANGNYASYSFRVPMDWNGSSVSFVFRGANPSGSSGAVKFDVSVACIATSGDYQTGVTFGTAGTLTYTNPAAATSQERTVSSISMSGCTAGQAALLKVFRDNTVASNLASSEYVMYPEMRYTRQ